MGVDLINPLEGLEKTIGNVVLVINLLRNRIILFFKSIFYKEFFLRIWDINGKSKFVLFDSH